VHDPRHSSFARCALHQGGTRDDGHGHFLAGGNSALAVICERNAAHRETKVASQADRP